MEKFFIIYVSLLFNFIEKAEKTVHFAALGSFLKEVCLGSY